MNQGYTLVWSGWDAGATNAERRHLHLTVPVAKNADGSAITGPSYEYIVIDNATTHVVHHLPQTAITDTTKATLTERQQSLTDTPVMLAATDWSWTSPNTIALAGNAPFQQSAIYELNYTAEDPLVAGIGFAAVAISCRSCATQTKDSAGTPNPLAGDVRRDRVVVAVATGADHERLRLARVQPGRRGPQGLRRRLQLDRRRQRARASTTASPRPAAPSATARTT